MNALDLAIIAIVALSAIFAFARGFVREALSIVAWAGAAAATLYGFNAVYAITLRFVATPLLADLVAGAGLFIGSLIALTIVTGLIARSVHTSSLSSIDRTLGFIFGLVRGVVLVSLAYLVLDISVPPADRPNWVRQAKSTPLLEEGAQMLRRVLPEQLQMKGAAALDSAQRGLEQAKEAKGAIDALSTPRAPQSVQVPIPRYNSQEKQQLDRLIQNQNGH
jgi:membrane protein required for colicin V production